MNKEQVIGAGFAFFEATGLHKAFAPLTRGRGGILMLHHVRPARSGRFAPNRLLEIEPAFLDAVLGRVRTLGYDIVTLDEVLRRLAEPAGRPFVALTFDDGYRDLVEHALPILERHGAPFTAYITTGFADRSASLWWVELEEALRTLDRVEADGATPKDLPSISDDEKTSAYGTIYWNLRGGPEKHLLDVIGGLARRAGIDREALVDRLCLDWDGVRRLARHPLCTIGSHTVSHPMLAKHPEAVVRRELAEGRSRLEMEIGQPVRHFAYPVGDKTSASTREFAIAAGLGFASAVTTRPGTVFAQHRLRPTALPRVSLNGNWQDLGKLDVLLSGVPFVLWNGGRRIA